MIRDLNDKQRKPYGEEARFIVPKPGLSLKKSDISVIKGCIYMIMYDITSNVLRTDLLETTYLEIQSTAFYFDVKVLLIDLESFNQKFLVVKRD